MKGIVMKKKLILFQYVCLMCNVLLVASQEPACKKRKLEASGCELKGQLYDYVEEYISSPSDSNDEYDDSALQYLQLQDLTELEFERRQNALQLYRSHQSGPALIRQLSKQSINLSCSYDADVSQRESLTSQMQELSIYPSPVSVENDEVEGC